MSVLGKKGTFACAAVLSFGLAGAQAAAAERAINVGGGQTVRMAQENPGPQKLGVITGLELNPITKNHEAALKMMRERYPDIEIKAIARTDYSTPMAMERAGPMVQANPDITLYYTAFSNLAKGLVPVLEQAGRLDRVKIYDNGATAGAVAALKVIGDLGAPLVEGQPPTDPYLIDVQNAADFKPEVD